MKWIASIGCLLVIVGCQKKEEAPSAAASAAPAPSASVAAVKEPEPVASASAVAPAASASAVAVEEAAEPKKPVSNGSIQACCTALGGAAAKGGSGRNRYAAAEAVCNGLEKDLKVGRATLGAAKVTLHAQLSGVPIPAGC